MRKSPILLILAALLAGCFSQKSDNSPVLARFDGTVVTQSQFQNKLESVSKDMQAAVSQRKKEFLEDMISEHFLMKEALRLGIDREPDVKDLIEAARKKIIVAKLVETEVDKKITSDPKEAEQYYETHKEEFTTPLLLRASHILVKTEAEAIELKAALVGGADFEELARSKSLDFTAIRGGDLGFFQKGRFVPEFEEAVHLLKKGDLSDPVKTQFGYHLIKLTDRSEPGLRDFQTVRRLVEERLVKEKRSKLFKAFVERLKANTKIHFEDGAIEKLS